MTVGRLGEMCACSSAASRYRSVALAVAAVLTGMVAVLYSAPAMAVLPQGRVYEMVAPVEKGGYGVSAIPQAFAALDGESAVFASFGVFAGEPTDLGGNLYMAQRSKEGWGTSPSALPITAEYVPGSPQDYSTDLSRSLSYVSFGQNGGQIGSTVAKTAALFLKEAGGQVIQASPILKTVGGGVLRAGYLGASLDFKHIVLRADDEEGGALLPSDTDETANLYEVDGAGGPSPGLRLVGVNSDGEVIDPHCPVVLGSGESAFHAISADGSRSFFTTNIEPKEGTKCDLTEGSFPKNPARLYARINGTKTLEVSTPLAGQCTIAPCSGAKASTAIFQGASESGEKAFFTTTQPMVNGDKDATNDLYEAVIEDEALKELVLVSEGNTEDLKRGEGASVQGVVRISDDGSHVYFVAQGVLTGENAETHTPLKGADNLYVYDTVTNEIKFIADLCTSKGKSGTATDASGCPGSESDASLWTSSDEERDAQSTSDGLFLVFSTYAQLTADDTDTARDVYEYNAAAGRLVRVSAGEEGYDNNGNNDEFEASITAPNFVEGTLVHQYEMDSRAVSEDGSTIVFSTPEPLSPEAANDQVNIYEWHEGFVGIISGGQALEPDEDPVVTPSGRDVFFTTTQGLVSQDKNGVRDLYDARIGGGGFPAAPESVSGCSGDPCQGPLGVSPVLSVPGSLSQPGGDNLQPPPMPVSKPASKIKKKAAAKKSSKRKKRKKKAKSSRKGARAWKAWKAIRGRA